jgi:hypothetical protein
MIARRKYSTFGVAIAALLWSSSAWCNVWRMECKEWRGPSPGGDFLGSYFFSFNDTEKTLVVVHKPVPEMNWLFGTKVKKWTLMWEKDGQVVVYGTDDDFTAPLKLLSLNFGKPKMFDYSLGGLTEDTNSRSLTRKECQRLN